MVDLFLVAEQSRRRFRVQGWVGGGGGVAAGGGGGGPEVDGAVVAGGDEPLGELVGGCGGFFEAGFGEGEFGGRVGRVFAGMVVIGGTEDGVGG